MKVHNSSRTASTAVSSLDFLRLACATRVSAAAAGLTPILLRPDPSFPWSSPLDAFPATPIACSAEHTSQSPSHLAGRPRAMNPTRSDAT